MPLFSSAHHFALCVAALLLLLQRDQSGSSHSVSQRTEAVQTSLCLIEAASVTAAAAAKSPFQDAQAQQNQRQHRHDEPQLARARSDSRRTRVASTLRSLSSSFGKRVTSAANLAIAAYDESRAKAKAKKQAKRNKHKNSKESASRDDSSSHKSSPADLHTRSAATSVGSSLASVGKESNGRARDRRLSSESFESWPSSSSDSSAQRPNLVSPLDDLRLRMPRFAQTPWSHKHKKQFTPRHDKHSDEADDIDVFHDAQQEWPEDFSEAEGGSTHHTPHATHLHRSPSTTSTMTSTRSVPGSSLSDSSRSLNISPDLEAHAASAPAESQSGNAHEHSHSPRLQHSRSRSIDHLSNAAAALDLGEASHSGQPHPAHGVVQASPNMSSSQESPDAAHELEAIQSVREELLTKHKFLLDFQQEWQNLDYMRTMHRLYPTKEKRAEWVDKCRKALEWRRDNSPLLIQSAANSGAIARVVQTGSIYWFGYDLHRRPILWMKVAAKDWSKYNAAEEVVAHVQLIDQAILHYMPQGVTQFVIIGQVDVGFSPKSVRGLYTSAALITFFRSFARALSTSYTNRLAGLWFEQTDSTLVSLIESLSSTFKSSRAESEKVVQSFPRGLAAESTLASWIGASAVPKWFGGLGPHPVDHAEIRSDSDDKSMPAGSVSIKLMHQNQLRMLKSLPLPLPLPHHAHQE